MREEDKKLNAAFGSAARRYAHKQLPSERLSMINMDPWDGEIKISPRIMIDVNDMSTDGWYCRKWAILELDRRFFDIKGEERFDDMMMIDMTKMKLSDHEEVNLVLDKRTIGREVIIDREQWKDATYKYKEAYVDFYVSQKAFERKKKREQARES